MLTQGEYYDLKKLYNQINSLYFNGKLNLRITWTGNKTVTPKTRLMFGSYNQHENLIKIHRRLDQPHIPTYFISYIVYHEMLHHVLPPIEENNRRRKIHHPAFIEKEKQFQEYDQAKAFYKNMKTSWFKLTHP